ncbi:MAG: nucleotide exchange factor GrpE [Gemmatimonadota bacterium]
MMESEQREEDLEGEAGGASASDTDQTASDSRVDGVGETDVADEGAGDVDSPEDGVAADAEGVASDGDEADTELTALREEFEALNDRHLRLVAEFNNFRRRSEQEKLASWSRAQADLVEKFLDVLDDLHRVADLDLSNATVEAIMEGIDLVEQKFVRTLGQASVEMVDPTGRPFDPEVMEAMMRVPAESDDQVDTVAQVFQKGYSLKGILVRPARVSVYTQG